MYVAECCCLNSDDIFGHIVDWLQGCQIKILQIGILLPEFGKFRKKYLANSEKIRKVVFKLFDA